MPPSGDVPQSIDTERAVFGVILLNNSVFSQASSLEPGDFFLPAHRQIFACMKDLIERGSPVDLVILTERLISDKQLDQVGGATYLSHLTDGMPRLENIEHYVKIVQEKSRLRRLIRAGDAVSRQAMGGESSAAVAQMAQELLPPQEPPKTRLGVGVPEKKYPTLPDSAWCMTARTYYEALRNSTSASEAYHLAIFIATAGLALGRTVFFRLPKPKYPNFFVALVGRAGKAKKGTAMDYGVDLLQDVAPDVPWLSSVDSAEGFVDFLSRNQKMQERKDIAALLCFAELRGLVDKASKEGSRNIIPKLAEAYDCGSKIEVGTRNNPLRANKPFTSLFGGASPTWLDKLSMSDLEGGLGSRFIWIPANPKEPFDDPPPINQGCWNSVVHTLGEVRKFWAEKKETEFVLTPAAKELWKPFFKKLYNSTGDDPLLEILGERMDLHCRKVAMVYAALERTNEISTAQLAPAIAFTEFLVESMYSIFSDFGLSEIVKQQRLILEHIERAGPEGITKRTLQKKLWRIDAEMFHRRLRWMTGDDGQIREEKIGRSAYLFLNK